MKANKNYDLQAVDDVKVRTAQPPIVLDSKGNPRKLTDAEKKAKKAPDPELPGYTATWAKLKPDLTVRVYFAARKKTPAPEVAKTNGKEKEKATEDQKAPVSVIVILDDEEPSVVAGKPK
jgi:hypothetical protein